MSLLSDEDVAKLTELCRIECSEEEKKALKERIVKVIHYFDTLTQIPTEDVIPAYSSMQNQEHLLREDEIRDVLPREQFLEGAPSHTGGLVRVPPVFKPTS